MSASKNKRVTLAAAILILLASCCLPSFASSAAPQETSITLVHDLLKACYPELFGQQHELHIHLEGALDNPWQKIYGFQFEVKLYNAHLEKYLNPPIDGKTGKRVAVPENRTLLEGGAYLPQGDLRIHDVSFSGEAANSSKNEAIHKLVQSHPEWSDAEANNALKQAGARYGAADKEEFLKALPLKQLEPIFGKLKLVSVSFNEFYNPEHLGNPDLSWQVRIDSRFPDGTKSRYDLFFEPFGGKLIGILKPRSAR